MDISSKITEFVNKIKDDEKLRQGFKENPIKTVENLLGVDLPDEQIQALIEGIKAKLNFDQAGDFLGNLFGKK